MGHVEREMMEAIFRLIQAGARGVTEEEALATTIPPEHPEYCFQPAYKHSFSRLRRRHLLDWVGQNNEGKHLYRPSRKAFEDFETIKGDIQR